MDARIEEIGSDWAFERYEAIRSRLPKAEFPNDPKPAPNLAGIAANFGCFVLDAFGVLNRGEMAIPGAVERMEELRRLERTRRSAQCPRLGRRPRRHRAWL